MDPEFYRPRSRPAEGVGTLEAPSLFDAPPESPPSAPAEAPHNGTATSRAAARRVSAPRDRRPSRAHEDRERIVQALRGAGPQGYTRPELAQATGIAINSVNPRVRELLDEQPPRVAERGERDDCAVLVHHVHVRPFGVPGEVDRA